MEDPDLKAELMATIGRTYSRLGLLEEGKQMLSGAIRLVRDGEAESRSLARFLSHLGEVEISSGHYESARESLQQSLEILLAAEPPDPLELARVHGLLGRAADRQGQADDAARHLAEARRLAEESGDAEVLEV